MENMLIIKPSGVQDTKLEVAPVPFNFERSVLSGGAMEPSVMKALVNLCFSEMFPPPKSNALFDWKDIMPHHLITYVSMYNTLNQSMNTSATSKGRPILPVQDSRLVERVSVSGMLSPKDIERNFVRPAMNTPSV